MAFYSSKCVGCTERSKRILKRVKYHDDKGTYYIQYYQCDNCSCNVVLSAARNEKKSRHSERRKRTYIKQTKNDR